MKKITYVVMMLLAALTASSQVTLIDPAGDGGFETGTTFQANGWSVANPTDANRKWYLGTGQSGYSGARSAFIGNSATAAATGAQERIVHLYRPVTIPAGAENIILTFKYKQAVVDLFEGDVYDFIAVFLDPAVPVIDEYPEGGLIFGPYPEVAVPAYTTQTITLPNSLAGTTANLIFTFTGDTFSPNGAGAIDDVSLTYIIPNCGSPSGFTSASSGENSVDISWNAPVTPSEGYQYYYSETATPPVAGTQPSGTSTGTSTTVPGLNSGTAYNIWLRTDCGLDSYSSWVGPLMVSTLCMPQTVPYTQGFENNDGLECVRLDDVNGATSWSLFTSGGNGAATGTNSIRYNWHATSPGDDWFFLKGLNLTGGVVYELKFKYKSSDGPQLLENLEVKYGSLPEGSAMTAGTIVTLAGINSAIAGPFSESTSTFTPSTTGTYYIGFHSFSAPDQAFLYVDDISVSATLGIDAVKGMSVKHYPNPVKDVLNLSYDQNITGVAIYNLLGQKVLDKQLNQASVQINMSELASGHYLVKVQADNLNETLKIVKE
jgi:hypothetical protein